MNMARHNDISTDIHIFTIKNDYPKASYNLEPNKGIPLLNTVVIIII